jgi:diguanylate cyclase (GGDEF)-like protein
MDARAKPIHDIEGFEPEELSPSAQDSAQLKNVFVVSKSTRWAHMLDRLGYNAVASDAATKPDHCVAVIVDFAEDPDLEICRYYSLDDKVVLISERDDFQHRLDAARAGVNAILPKTTEAVELGGWLSDFEDEMHTKHSILIVDDDEIMAEAYSMALRHVGMEVHVCNDPREALAATLRFNPELVLMDMHMPGTSGLEVAQVLRQFRQNLSLPIVFLSAEKDEDVQREARSIGGDDFIAKPVNLERLVNIVSLRAKRAHLLRQAMEKDSLTGLLNHARFKDRLMLELARSERTGSPTSVALLDLDHFKQINDKYGHQAGDVVIQTLAHSLRGWLRHTDVIARYGGEEFAVILLDTPLENAQKVMDKIRQSFSELDFQTGGDEYQVSMSVGLTDWQRGDSIKAVIHAADTALYDAKDAGRNCVKVAQRTD